MALPLHPRRHAICAALCPEAQSFLSSATSFASKRMADTITPTANFRPVYVGLSRGSWLFPSGPRQIFFGENLGTLFVQGVNDVVCWAFRLRCGRGAEAISARVHECASQEKSCASAQSHTWPEALRRICRCPFLDGSWPSRLKVCEEGGRAPQRG